MKTKKSGIEKAFFASPGARIKGIAVASLILNAVLIVIACVVAFLAGIVYLFDDPTITLMLFGGILLSPILFLSVWIYFIFVYGMGELIENSTYLRRYFSAQPSVTPSYEKKRDAQARDDDENVQQHDVATTETPFQDKQADADEAVESIEAPTEEVEQDTPSEPIDEAQQEEQYPRATAVTFKNNKGESNYAVDVLREALLCQSNEGLLWSLKPYKKVPVIAKILALPQDEIRPAVEALMNQIMTGDTTWEKGEKTQAATVEQEKSQPAPLTVPDFIKNRHGRKFPTSEILLNALAYRSDNDMVDYLQDFSANPVIAAVLAKSERQIRPALRSLLNQIAE